MMLLQSTLNPYNALQRMCYTRYASGEKPAAKTTPKAGDVTGKISGASKTFSGGNSSNGRGQAMQSGTAAGINNAVDTANKKFDQRSG